MLNRAVFRLVTRWPFVPVWILFGELVLWGFIFLLFGVDSRHDVPTRTIIIECLLGAGLGYGWFMIARLTYLGRFQ